MSDAVWPLPGSRAFPAFVKGIVEDYCPTSLLKDHQKVVAKFLSKDSPYRGLLLMHGIGSGKTSASIAAASAAARPVWAIIPASLKNNFEKSLDQDVALAEYACNKRDKPDVRYLSLNGMTRKVVADLERAATNPFDNTVIVVDECHRLIQAVAKTGEEATLSKRLYDMLYAARGAKLVLLSATPLINVPRELAYLVNLCNGPLHEHRVRWTRPLNSVQAAAAKAALLKVPAVMDATATASGAVIKFAPEGFSAVSRSKGTVVRAAQGAGSRSAAVAAVKKFAGRDAELETERFSVLPPSDFEAKFVHPETGAILREALLLRRLRGCVSFFEARDESLYPAVEDVVQSVPMSDTQYAVYSVARAAEREIERNARQRDDDLSVHRSYSRATLNFVFPAKDAVKVYKSQIRARLKSESRAASNKDVEREHARQMATNVRKLKGSKIWRDDAALAEHSPKFAAVLRALLDRPGSAMLYSGFRELEGLGLMSHLLMTRGFRRLDIIRTDGKNRRFALVGPGSGPAFIVPVLNTDDGNDLVRLFNGEKLSAEMERSAQRLFGPVLDNRRGELVKLVMLSASGKEGISLKCVRSVHILEPHWNSTQLDQVAGRAVRMNSHAALPPDERDVLVTTYVSTFSDAQRAAPDFEKTFAKTDLGRTSDEALVDISAQKKRTLGALSRLMERSAVDCTLWGSRCYAPPDFHMEPDISAVDMGAKHAVQVPGGTAAVRVHLGKVYSTDGEYVGDVRGDVVKWKRGPLLPVPRAGRA